MCEWFKKLYYKVTVAATGNAIFMRCLTSTTVHGGQSVHSLSEKWL